MLYDKAPLVSEAVEHSKCLWGQTRPQQRGQQVLGER